MNWAAKLLRASRPFIRRLIDLMCTVNRPSHHVRLNKGVKEDLQWLLNACDMFNGTVVIVKKPLSPEPSFSSDACTTGGAAFYNGDWLYANWSIDYPEVQNAHINIKELFTVLLAFRRWGPLWENKHVQIYTDNQVTMYALNKGTMRNDLGMTFIRELYYMLAVHNIHITVSFVASRDNIIADGLSRLDNIDYALVSGEMLDPYYVLTNSYYTLCMTFRGICLTNVLLLFPRYCASSGTKSGQRCIVVQIIDICRVDQSSISFTFKIIPAILPIFWIPADTL